MSMVLGRPAVLVDGTRAPRAPTGSEQVVHVEDPDQVVDVVVVDRKAAVAGLADRPGDVVGMHRDRKADDVDTRGHHLAHGRVAQVGERREDVALLLVGDVAGGCALKRSRRGPRRPSGGPPEEARH